ncbi:MAG TPA: hypothetical protein VEG68_07845 [Terriglobales bacterium]|nr:hypothetical protein [Terriglobales bacterium]
MPTATIEVLRLANRNLRAGLERLQSARNTAAIRTEDLSFLRSEVLRAAECTHNTSPDNAGKAGLEKEISECRNHLQQLSQILPLIHIQLRARKGRLEAALGHLQAVAAWADASRESL